MLKLKKFILFISILLFLVFNFFIHRLFFADKDLNMDYDNLLHTSSNEESYEIFIDLSEYLLYLFKGDNVIKIYPVAGGKDETPSPFGVWKIINKYKWGEGFGGHWLGLNVPWGKYGIHGTTQPQSIGDNISQGCIRMYSENAKELWDIIPLNTRVIVSNGPFSPFTLSPRNIKPGDRGADVIYIQKILRKKGLYHGDIDGIYGDNMKKSVFEIQKQHNITPQNEINKETLNGMGVIIFE